MGELIAENAGVKDSDCYSPEGKASTPDILEIAKMAASNLEDTINFFATNLIKSKDDQ